MINVEIYSAGTHWQDECRTSYTRHRGENKEFRVSIKVEHHGESYYETEKEDRALAQILAEAVTKALVGAKCSDIEVNVTTLEEVRRRESRLSTVNPIG